MNGQKSQFTRNSTRFRRFLIRGTRGLVVVGGGLVGLWIILALFYFPAWPAVVRWMAALGWIGVSVWAIRTRGGRGQVITLLVGGALAFGLGAFVTPSNDRSWMLDQARWPIATVQDAAVTIENVRFFNFRSADDFDVRWETRAYDLDAIRTVDFIIEPFSSWKGLAHTFLTFGFADGEYVAISVEIRKEQGESFSPVRGLFRNYELAYVIGDERDLIGLRANIRHDPVMLFPIRASPPQVRALFVSMLERANGLRSRPEFYHSVFNTCTTNLMHHVNELRRQKLGLGWRTIFPGYADALAMQLNLLDFDGTLEEARRRFLINDRAAFDDAIDGREWSRRIRAVREEQGATK